MLIIMDFVCCVVVLGDCGGVLGDKYGENCRKV